MSAMDEKSWSAAGGNTLEPGERAELEQLRAEVTELRGHRTERRRRLGWRAPIATLLIVLGCVLAPLSVLSVWTANQVSNTSRYVANMAPLASDPAIQRALTDKITNEISSHLNVVGYTDVAASQLASKGLTRAGTALKSFAPQIASAVSGFVHSQVQKVVTSPGFAPLWVRLNTVVHAQLVKALSGQGSKAISIQNGFSAKYLVKAQSGYRVLNDLKIALPIAALLLLGAGVYIARNHRRALVGAGLGLATSMFVLAALLLIFRGIYLNSVPNSKLPADAAAALFDTLVRFIRQGLRTLLVLGLVVAAAAFLTGSSVSAVRTRAALSSGLRWLRERGELAGLRTGPVGQWTYAHRKALRIGAVGVAVLIFVFWGRPTGAVVIGIALVLVLVLGLIELIGRPPPASPAEAARPGR